MSNIAVIGNVDIILIFSRFGFKVYLLEEDQSLEEKIDLVLKEDNPVIFIQEDLLKDKEHLLKNYTDKDYPLLMPLPIYKDFGLIKKMLSWATLKAIGKELD